MRKRVLAWAGAVPLVAEFGGVLLVADGLHEVWRPLGLISFGVFIAACGIVYGQPEKPKQAGK